MNGESPTGTRPALGELRADHVSIHVRDFDGAMAWYREVLGFETEVAWSVGALGGKRLAYLAVPGGARIELVAASGGAGPDPAADFAEHFDRPGYGHLCFRVDDVDAAMVALAARGVPAFAAAATYPLDGTPYERRVAFVQDPEGNVVEFAGPLRKAPRPSPSG